MAKTRGTRDTYSGRSGQMAVMAELLDRQCNVAVPEVDVGTDVFAFLDEREVVARIQVKTAKAEGYKKGEGYRAQFSIPLRQLELPDNPPLYYALAVRLKGRFVDFLVFSRRQLYAFWNGPLRFGSEDSLGNLVLKVQFRQQVVCGEVDLTDHRNAWHILPPLSPFPELR
jgi:hypothetical protein